jgi:ABC-type Mn2+/Zn2+ transport system permease subunit/Mn-dependent DtxR family transcriptional regulator
MFDLAYQWLVDLDRHSPHLLKAMIAGTLVSTVCGVIGCFIILRRTAFLADALAHSMLAGVVSGYLFMKLVFGSDAYAPAMIIGSVIAGFLTVGMVGFVSRFSRIKEDAVIGIMYTGIFALGGVLLSLFSRYVHIDLVHFLTGQLLAIQYADLWMMALVTAGVLAVVILFFRQLQLVSFDRVMAASIGIPVLAIDYLLTTCTSLVVVAGVNVVGVILVVGLLIIPAATAYLLCDRLPRMLAVSAAFGVTSFLCGYVLSEIINIAPGSAIVVTAAFQFLVVFVVAPRYGLLADWLRRRRAVPQRLVEDVLGSILRAAGKAVPMSTVLKHVQGRPEPIQRAIRALERQDLLQVNNGALTLTEAGDREARRLLRAHRLWETYLEHVGTPVEKLHDQAHVLEHVHDRATVDYLDDKLGHPLHDPHGSEIPEDTDIVVPGKLVKVSLLREGRRATVTDIGPAAGQTELAPGMQVTAGPRQQNERIWTLLLPDGRQICLDHQAADAVTVQLEPVDIHT